MRSRPCVLVLLVLLLPVSSVHATPAHLWSHSYGDSDDQFLDACFADPFGNIGIVGSFYGSINITTPFTSFGRRDVIVAKFAPNGTPMWSDRIGYTSVDTGWSGTSDNVGNTIVVGSVGPTANERTAFIARYSPTGVQQWIKYFPSTDSTSYCEVVSTDQAKHIHVAGRFSGNINFGGSTLVSQSDGDIFLAEFDAGGSHQWSTSFTTTGYFGELGGIATDLHGQPTIFGTYQGTTNFGGGDLAAFTTSDLYLAKFSQSGAHMWSQHFGETGTHTARALAVDASGRLAITGESWGKIEFGGPELTPVTEPDIFLAVFEPDGDHIWSKMFGAGDFEVGWDVTFASNTDVILSSYARGTDPFSFGGAPLAGQPFNGDLLIARFFVADGTHRWSTKYSGTGGDTSGFVAATGSQIVLAGTMTANTNFGGGPLSNAGGEQIFIARFGDVLTGAGPLAPQAVLLQNTPNPFNPTTRIEYTLSQPAHAILEIFDASGAMVARLDQGEQPSGSHETTWNGRDANGRTAASGVYFYRLAGMSDVPARKMVLLK